MKKKDNDDDNSLIDTALSSKSISFKVEEHFYDRVEKHIRSLKFLERQNIKKKHWFTAAIKEKLSRDKKLDIPNIPLSKHLQFPIDEELHSEFTKHLDLIKMHRNYSAKQLIVDAILEKLDREEAEIRERLSKKDKD
jgi:hypothetical protein